MSTAKFSALETRVTELEQKLEKFMTSELAAAGGKVKKAKKDRVKRGPSAWSLFVKHVTGEMKKANPDAKLKLPDIAGEAKKRKDSGAYDEAHWKAEAAKINV